MFLKKIDWRQLPNLATETSVDERTVKQIEALCQSAEKDNEHCIHLANISLIRIRYSDEYVICSGGMFFSEDKWEINETHYVRQFLKSLGLKIEKLEHKIVRITFPENMTAKLSEESRFEQKWRIEKNHFVIGTVLLAYKYEEPISSIKFDFCM